MEPAAGAIAEVVREGQSADRSLMDHETKSEVRIHVEHGWELVEQGRHWAETATAPRQVRARQECVRRKQYRRDNGSRVRASQAINSQVTRLSQGDAAFAKSHVDGRADRTRIPWRTETEANMKWFLRRKDSEVQPQSENETPRVIRMRRFGLRHFGLPRPRLANDRTRVQGWLRLPAE